MSFFSIDVGSVSSNFILMDKNIIEKVSKNYGVYRSNTKGLNNSNSCKRQKIFGVGTTGAVIFLHIVEQIL